MPHGRKKVPFSGKAKKEQLKAKKHSKSKSYSGQKVLVVRSSDDDLELDGTKKDTTHPRPNKITSRNKSSRYALKFFNESQEEILLKKEEAKNEVIPVPLSSLEISGDNFYDEELDFPKRPEWSYDMTLDDLDYREKCLFKEYIHNLEKIRDVKNLSYFELNLETWRQLWRVLEMSDIILFIIDIRYAAAMFPPLMYNYVTNDLHKEMILVLNKIDLAPPSLVVAWKHYFTLKYPKLHVIMFTTIPGYNLRNTENNASGLKIRRRKGRQRMATEGSQLLFEACKDIVGGDVDLSSWEEKIKEEMFSEYNDEDGVKIGQLYFDKSYTDYYKHEKYKGGILTIGCLGQPNVGKSSLMNAIMGKKVVSVSRSPGHTKHFQTIFLTPNVRLCDCPGLVFPSKVPKALQILMGSYPIAQVRDPYTSIRYVAERINLPALLKLQHPTNDDTWSPIDICDGWAKKRSFFTAKAARLDTYRAANALLRMCLDGKICLCLYPPDYTKKEGEWQSHPDVKTVTWIQSFTNNEGEPSQTSKQELLDESGLDESEDSESEYISERPQSNSSQDSDDILIPLNFEFNKFMLLSKE